MLLVALNTARVRAVAPKSALITTCDDSMGAERAPKQPHDAVAFLRRNRMRNNTIVASVTPRIARPIHPPNTARPTTTPSIVATAYTDLRPDGAPVVSLHVRRGDLAHAVEKLDDRGLVYGGPVGLEYINAAMRHFDATCHFLVFSDTVADIEWCRQHIHGPHVHYSSGHTDMEDFALMSACDHHIIANSTFSWWAAWLDPKPGKRVIAPRQWGFPDARFKMVPDDLIPPEWQLI